MALGQHLANASQGPRLIAQLNEEDFSLEVRNSQVLESLDRPGGVAGEEAEHPLFVVVHDSERHQVHLFPREGGQQIGQTAGLVLQEHRHLPGCIHDFDLPLMVFSAGLACHDKLIRAFYVVERECHQSMVQQSVQS
jgi:hypothetical protein